MDFIKELFRIETKYVYMCSECAYKSKFRRHLVLHTNKKPDILGRTNKCKGARILNYEGNINDVFYGKTKNAF